MRLKKGTVSVQDYNPNWVNEFNSEEKLLREIFGDLALSIEHIGSTSIVGLKAKPIIDIAVGLNNLKDFEKVKNQFLIKPYSVKEDSVDGEVLVRKGSEENITHFIHVMELSSKRYMDSIVFRDYLRKHENVMKEYENLKVNLAEKYKDDRKMYTASKHNFITEIIEKAYLELD